MTSELKNNNNIENGRKKNFFFYKFRLNAPWTLENENRKVTLVKGKFSPLMTPFQNFHQK